MAQVPRSHSLALLRVYRGVLSTARGRKGQGQGVVQGAGIARPVCLAHRLAWLASAPCFVRPACGCLGASGAVPPRRRQRPP